MKTPTLFATCLIALAGAATAASAQQASTPWTGWYLGMNLGGAWGDTSHSLEGVPGSGPVVMPLADVNQISQVGGASSNPGGVTFGGEGGYNWLFKYQAGNTNPDYILVGIETDFDFIDLKQSRSGSFQSALAINPLITPPMPATATVTQSTKTDWMWTLRPRLGYNTGSWLFYGTVGMALPMLGGMALSE